MAPPKRPWFRMYCEAFTDPDLRAIPPAQRWTWGALMSLARQSPVPGALVDKAGEPVGPAVIADHAAVKPAEAKAALRRFEAYGWLSEVEGVVVLTKWDRRQYESDDVTARTRKHRATKSDGTFHRAALGTFQGGGDGTESLSVGSNKTFSTEEQRPEPSPSASEEPPADDEPGGGIEYRLTEAARLLAEAEAQRRGNEIGNSAGYVRSRIKPIRDDHEAAWRLLLAAAPSTTAAQLVAGEPMWTEADKAVRAMSARMEVNERRKRGEVCPLCEDRGVVELDDGSFDDCACKARSSA